MHASRLFFPFSELEFKVHEQSGNNHFHYVYCNVSTWTGLAPISETKIVHAGITGKVFTFFLRRGMPFSIASHWVEKLRIRRDFRVYLVMNAYPPDQSPLGDSEAIIERERLCGVSVRCD
jgi:hypothetical protein